MATIHPLPAHLSPALTRREAITDAITRFLVALDTSDKPLFESAFTASATLNINGTVLEGLPALVSGCYDLISKLDTTHFLTNVRINVEESGKRAGVTASALSQHYRAGEGLVGGMEALLVGCLYWVEVVRDEGEEEFWRILHFTLKSTWADGEWGILKA
ncbi:hypothetical protein BJY00DRAFT_285737 [Aspergillus carlsbadensis]|nr:hypothetical protein BJY00DRAFT_285737 [Aspergillus carlsbadensis]